MKPQNILIGKGGVAKLCDFGYELKNASIVDFTTLHLIILCLYSRFARAMSMETIVLTSIKVFLFCMFVSFVLYIYNYSFIIITFI